MHVALPLRIHANTLKGACHHEIGTHMVRYCNNHKQLWHVSGPGANAKRHRFGLSPIYSPGLEATEEGLAVLNSSFDTEGKSLYYSALHYYAICMSHELDFVGNAGTVFNASQSPFSTVCLPSTVVCPQLFFCLQLLFALNCCSP